MQENTKNLESFFRIKMLKLNTKKNEFEPFARKKDIRRIDSETVVVGTAIVKLIVPV